MPSESQWLNVDIRHKLINRPEWIDEDYRQGYMEAAVEEGVAWQIRANRTKREMSQEKLADALGTLQSAVSRLEDPEYGKHSIETLLKIANVFDCALLVKFIPYSRLAEESEDLSPDALYAQSYKNEFSTLVEYYGTLK